MNAERSHCMNLEARRLEMMTKTVSGEVELLLYPGDQIHVQILLYNCWKIRIIM